jgi:hypothetical protein
MMVDTAVAACLGAAICLLAAQPSFANIDSSPRPPIAADTVPTFDVPRFDKPQAPVKDGPDAAAALELLEADLTPEERATVAIFDRNTPSVVNIANLAAYSRKCAPTYQSAHHTVP